MEKNSGKITIFLRSSGVVSRGTGSSGKDLKSGQGREMGTNKSYSREEHSVNNKMEGSEAIKGNTKTPTSERLTEGT